MTQTTQYTVVYSAGNINQTVNGTIDEIKAAMVSRFPNLQGVEPIISNNVVTFTASTGSKATQYTVVYSAGNINQTVNGTIDEIKAAMVSRFPNLQGVEPVLDGSILTFVASTGSKAVTSV